MNRRQRESTTKYLYDISKIIFAAVVIEQITRPESFRLGNLISGTVGTILGFVWAYLLEKGVD